MKRESFSNLSSFLGNIQKAKMKSNKSKGLDLARLEMERKNVLDLNLVVGVDCSGSISTAMFQDFMTQLNMIKGMSRIKVVEVSDIIEAVYDFTKKGKIARLRGGGGNGEDLFFPMAKKMNPDAIIYMTDGYCIGGVNNPQIPTAWILTANGRKPYDWGFEVGRLPH